MKNGISKLVEELEAAQDAVKETHARVVELRRQLAEELGLHPGPSAPRAPRRPSRPRLNGHSLAPRKRFPAAQTDIAILAALGRRKRRVNDIAERIGRTVSVVQARMEPLRMAGKVLRITRGVYCVAGEATAPGEGERV